MPVKSTRLSHIRRHIRFIQRQVSTALAGTIERLAPLSHVRKRLFAAKNWGGISLLRFVMFGLIALAGVLASIDAPHDASAVQQPASPEQQLADKYGPIVMLKR
jgi:hypothetical protein